MFRTIWLPLLAVFCVSAPQSPAAAEEDSALLVTEEWSIPAKVGFSSEFMAALREHAIWRRDNGDPWTWEFYTSQAGREDAGVLLRSTNHKYADAAYVHSEFNKKAGKHWEETVAPYAGVGTRHLRFQTPVRYWPDGTYDYLLVSQVDVESDSAATLMKAAATLTDIVREAGLEVVYGLEYTWAGGGPAYQYVEGYKDWASTSPGSPLATKQHKVIVEKLGEEEANATYEAAQMLHTPKMKIYKRLDW